MKNHILLLLVSIFFYSCNKKEDSKKIVTNNQTEILSVYNDVNKNFLEGSDSVDLILKKIDNLSKSEPSRYKAIASICNGIMNVKQSTYEVGIKNFTKAILILENSNTDTLTARAYNGIANCYKNKGDYPKSVYNYQKALKIYQKTKHAEGIANIYAGLGQVYLQKNDINVAKINLELAKKTLNKQKHKPAYLIASHTLANIYGMSGDIKNALKIDKEGIRITDSINSNHFKVTFLDNKANCFMYSNQLDSAQIYFEKCLEIDLQLDDKKQIADTYSNLGQLAIFKKDYPIAEKQILKSLEILKSINQKPNMTKAYGILEELYTKQGDYKKIIETQKLAFRVYKEMISEKKEASIAEFNVLYETQEKEQQILQSKSETSEKQNQLIITSIIALGLLLIGFLIYRQQKQKNKQQEQEHKLKTAISQIENQNKLQEQRLSISRDLHDNIGAQLTFIISSVDNVKYAFDITNEKLDNKLTNISSFAKETIVELRDTIWAMNSNAISYEDLEVRINNFIEKAKEAKDQISFSFAIDESLRNTKLTSVEGMNIYRTIQEAINNSIKYANASIISINVKKLDSKTKITISDNGIGFNEATIEKGNGLQNMKKRVEEIGGKFSLTSGNDGTKIEIIV